MGHFVIVPGLMSLLAIVIAGVVACRVTRPVDFAAGVGGGLVIGLAAFLTALPTAAFAYIVFRALRTSGVPVSHDVLCVVYDLVNGFVTAFVAALGARRVARDGDFAVGLVVGLGAVLVAAFVAFVADGQVAILDVVILVIGAIIGALLAAVLVVNLAADFVAALIAVLLANMVFGTVFFRASFAALFSFLLVVGVALALVVRRAVRRPGLGVGLVVGLVVDLVLGFGLAFGHSFFSALENPLTAPYSFVLAAGFGVLLGAVGAKGVSSRRVVAGVLISVAVMMLPRHERQIRRPEWGGELDEMVRRGQVRKLIGLGLAFITASMCMRVAATTRLSWTSRR
jgi:hypothetical protein